MNKKRVISAVLSLAMAAGMALGLSGCGGKESDTLVWYTLGDEPADLQTVLTKANEIIEPKLGLKLDMRFIDAASYTEKMKLKMASNEAYDLAFTGYVNNYQNAVAMGGLYDITELVEEVGMSEAVPQFYLDSAKVHGKIYGIPNQQVVSNPGCLMVDKALLEEIGVDYTAIEKAAQNGKTLEERKVFAELIDDMFAKIKAARPDLYTFNPGSQIAMDAVYEDVVEGIIIKRDGSSQTLERKDANELFKYSVQKIHEWYKNGYIRRDIASEGNSLASNEAYRQVAVITNTWKPGQQATWDEKLGYEVQHILLNKPYVGRTSPLATMVSVGANAKHPKEAVELIKLMNTDKELYNIICWGVEGTHYTKNEEGKIKEIEDSGYNAMGVNAWRYGNQFNALLTEAQDDNVWTETEEMNNTAMISPMMGFVPNTDSVSTELANIASVIGEFKAKTHYGTEDPSTWYADYEQKLTEAGIDKVLAELQKQYDEFLASKN